MRIEICTIPSDGGEETCLTDGKGYNDGPEYSPDGKHIWFNSTRSGLMQVWRMNRDGSGLTQMTDSDANNWFGHVSPDGKHVIYLTFAKGELEPNEHLPNMYVSLGMMDYDGQNKKKLLDLSGAAGILQCCRIHIHNLQCTVCAGELEAGFQINHAFSKRRFLAGDFHIFIMNGFDSVRMRPEELFRVDAAAIHPARKRCLEKAWLI